MPFDSLKGFKNAIKAKEKIIVQPKELSEDTEKSLQYKIIQIQKGMIVKIIFYQNYEYMVIEGMVSKIDIENKNITIVKTIIDFKDIYEINGQNIKDLND